MKNSVICIYVLLLAAVCAVMSGCGRGRGCAGAMCDSVAVECDSLADEPEPVIEVDDEVLGLRQGVRPIDAIVIHCSASGDDYDLPLDSVIVMHRRKGWRNIGYHFYITRDGVIHKGRNLTVQGAHVRGHNRTTVGICYEGGLRRASRVRGMEKVRVPEELKEVRYEVFDAYVGRDTVKATAIGGVPYVSFDTRTKAQRMALDELVAHLRAIYPKARVLGHRDYSPDRNHDGVISPKERIKDCPCYDVRE